MSAPRLVLGIDTATRTGSIALAEDGQVLLWETLHPGGHSSGISRAAERMLGARGKRIADLSAVAVSGGPGSFTGLRIGLAWAKGVCLGSRAKLVLVSSHEAHGHSRREAAPWTAVALPGERGEVQVSFWQGGATAILLWGPERVDDHDLVSVIDQTALRFMQGPDARQGRLGVAIAGPDLKPGLHEELKAAGYGWLTPIAGADALPPVAAAVSELGDRELVEGREADPMSAAPVYGREPNARKPSK